MIMIKEDRADAVAAYLAEVSELLPHYDVNRSAYSGPWRLIEIARVVEMFQGGGSAIAGMIRLCAQTWNADRAVIAAAAKTVDRHVMQHMRASAALKSRASGREAPQCPTIAPKRPKRPKPRVSAKQIKARLAKRPPGQKNDY